MQSIPDDISTRFEDVLDKRGIDLNRGSEFKKWLRYFLDFCAKYPIPEARSDQVRLFIQKLQEKGQASFQQKQAAYAVSLYFEIHRKGKNEISPVDVDTEITERGISFSTPFAMEKSSMPPKSISSDGFAQRQPWHKWDDGYTVTSDSPEWDTVIAALASEIKTLV
ncbi:MAG: hypothetical protein QME42_04315 [bacterium]|nr:hypothetical protein [bacterium]